MLLLLLLFVLLAVFLIGPVVLWQTKLQRWERAITSAPGEWVRVLTDRAAAPGATGPVLFSCGVPSQKLGPAHLVAFDADDLIVVRQGVIRRTSFRTRRTDRPAIHFHDRTLLQPRTMEISSRAGSAAIRKGPVTSIARYLSVCGWDVDPMPEPDSTESCGDPMNTSGWPLPSILSGGHP